LYKENKEANNFIRIVKSKIYDEIIKECNDEDISTFFDIISGEETNKKIILKNYKYMLSIFSNTKVSEISKIIEGHIEDLFENIL